jgi:hypothetical protein
LPFDGAQVPVDFRLGEFPPRRGMPEPEGQKKAQASRTDTQQDHPEAPLLVIATPLPPSPFDAVLSV